MLICSLQMPERKTICCRTETMQTKKKIHNQVFDQKRKKKIKPRKMIRLATANLNKTKSEKHSLEHKEMKKKVYVYKSLE